MGFQIGNNANNGVQLPIAWADVDVPNNLAFLPIDFSNITNVPATPPPNWNTIQNVPSNLARFASFESMQEISFTTLNNAFQNVFSVDIALNEVVNYQIDLLGRRQGTNQVWFGKYQNIVVNNAGTLTQIGLQQVLLRENFATNAAIQAVNVGLQHNFNVHSGATQAVNWKGKITIYRTVLL